MLAVDADQDSWALVAYLLAELNIFPFSSCLDLTSIRRYCGVVDLYAGDLRLGSRRSTATVAQGRRLPRRRIVPNQVHGPPGPLRVRGQIQR